jgi:methyltransferase (TIGR00027 family)
MAQPYRQRPPTDVCAAGVGVAVLQARICRRADRLPNDTYDQPFADADETIAIMEGVGSDFFESMADRFAVRTLLLDETLLGAARAGITQVVLLASGLDSRAFRLNWPSAVTVYEIDEPEVLAFKARVVDESLVRPRCHRVVTAVDLCGDWSGPLVNVGFDPTLRTAWLIEGILDSFASRQADTFLDRITACSAPASMLALDHSADSVLLRRAVQAAVSSEFDSQGGPSGDLHAWLGKRGWEAKFHDMNQVAAKYGRLDPPPFDPCNSTPSPGWLITAHNTAT